MKPIVFAALLTFLSTVTCGQTPNLDKLPEKERTEYLLKTAYEAVMKHAPEWYRDYREPEIKTMTGTIGADRGRLRYVVTWFHNPEKEEMEYGFAVAVGIYSDTGLVRGLSFGNGEGMIIPQQQPKARGYIYDSIYPFEKPKR